MQRITGSLDEGRITFGEKPTAPTTTATDPVCGMAVDPIRAGGVSVFEEHSYFFCSEACKGRFDAEPQKYAAPR